MSNSVIHDDVTKWKHFPRYCHRWISPKRPATRSFDGFIDLRLNKPLCNNPNTGDLKRYRAHYDVTVIYRPPPTQFLIIATIIKQPISRLFNRHQLKKYGLSATFFGFPYLFYSTPNLNIITLTPPQMNLIAFPLVYLRICTCKLSLHKHTCHMYWNEWASTSLSCINKAD